MTNITFIFTATKLKSKINFVALRLNKKFTFYCDKLSIESKKSQYSKSPNIQIQNRFRFRFRTYSDSDSDSEHIQIQIQN